MSAGCKARILDRFPTVMVNDGFGSSEAGIQGSSRVTAGRRAGRGWHGALRPAARSRSSCSTTTTARCEPGSGVIGRIVTGGRLPLGYHNDPEKTAATFLEVDGERWLITGDLATVAEDGTLDLLGRGSTSINTGGEKVHPEEVEGVLHGHPAVVDVLVVGVPDERWGSAVTAVVAAGRRASRSRSTTLAAHCKAAPGRLQGAQAPRAGRRASCAAPPARPTTAGPLDTATGAPSTATGDRLSGVRDHGLPRAGDRQAGR